VVAGVKPHGEMPGVYWIHLEDGALGLATLNLTPGRGVYGERLLRVEDREYRLWDPFRSKLAAAIIRGAKHRLTTPGGRVLYLGASTGTTASHVSDIVGPGGSVYCVEFAPRAMRELVNNVCSHRLNMLPIMEDARLPERYKLIVPAVDAIYCDVAQQEQAKILADNADLYLKPGGRAMLAVKARSIDATKALSEIFRLETEKLRARGFKIDQAIRLAPYDRAHTMLVATKE
jgi:fibrillarin-like pre-rRNA processing protein